MKRIVLTQTISAPLAVVWEAITNHEGMVDWSPLRRVVLAQEGTPDRNGVGAIRHMMGTGPTVVEEVTEWSPPNLYRYQLLAGAPIRDHKGTVELTHEGGMTHITWTIQFRPLVPGIGWLIVGILRIVIQGMLRRLQSNLEARGAQV